MSPFDCSLHHQDWYLPHFNSYPTLYRRVFVFIFLTEGVFLFVLFVFALFVCVLFACVLSICVLFFSSNNVFHTRVSVLCIVFSCFFYLSFIILLFGNHFQSEACSFKSIRSWTPSANNLKAFQHHSPLILFIDHIWSLWHLTLLPNITVYFNDDTSTLLFSLFVTILCVSKRDRSSTSMVILYVECGFVGNCRETVFEEVFCRQIVRPAHLGLRLIFSRIEQQNYMVNFLTGLPFFSRKMEKKANEPTRRISWNSRYGWLLGNFSFWYWTVKKSPFIRKSFSDRLSGRQISFDLSPVWRSCIFF